MNKPNTPSPISRAKLFSLLAARVEGEASPTESGTIKTLDLPSDLSQVLDELISLSESALGAKPATTLSEILRLGMHAWYNALSNDARNDLGLQEPAPEEIEDDDDPNPAMAQQQADAYAQAMGTVGYTPMTIHSLGVNGGSKQHNQPRARKKVAQSNSSASSPSSDRRRRKNRGRRR